MNTAALVAGTTADPALRLQLLPAYTGPTVECPKCRAQHADTEWLPTTTLLSAWGQLIDQSRSCDSGEPGWLLRTCSRCRYRWAEATEDGRPAQ